MKQTYKIFTFYFCMILVGMTMNTDAQTINGSISGTVKTSDGNPAAYVNIQIKDTNKGTVTSETGTYSFRGLKEGSYTLRISFVGLQTQEKTVSVVRGQAIQSDFTLVENTNKLAEILITSNRTVNQKQVTAGKGGLTALDMPQAVQILDSVVIRDQQVNRLSDVMKNVNGVALAENRGSTNEAFFARGYNLGANNVLKNGSRSSGGGMPEASTLESVEVLKGSAALLYGGVTGGAVINMITKKPKFTNGGELGLRTGSYGLIKPSGDIYGPVTDKIAYRIIATTENADSYRNKVQTNRVYVNPSVLFKLGNGNKTELLVQGDYLHSDYTPDFGIGTVANKIVNIGRGAFLNTVWAYNNTTTLNYQANLSHKISDNWKVNTIVSYQEYNRDYFSAERPFADASGVAARNLSRSKSWETTYNQQVNLTGSANTWTVKHQFLIGADADESRTTSYGFKYDNNTNAYAYGNINLLNPATYNTRTDMPNTRVVSNTFTPVYRMGAFAQDLISLTEKVKLLAGLRYTFQKQPRSQVYSDETGLTTLSSNGINKSKTEDAFSPKLGLIYQPFKSSSVYVSYASNFTSNSGTDVNLVPMTPSIIDQYEAGIKNDFLGGKMSVNLTWYRIINSNFAQTALFKADGVTPNADATIKEFSGSTSSDGFEIDITGKLAKGLNFLGGYSYNFFRYTKTRAGGTTEGERIVGSTPHTANGTVFYTIGSGNLKGLKLGASAFYTGSRMSGYNSVKAPGVARGVLIPLNAFTTFDLSAGYSFKRLSVLAKVANITDELNYYVHENYSVNPIPPRNFITTLSYKF